MPEPILTVLQLLNIQQIIYMPGIFLVKAAVLLQLSDIFVAKKRNARWWIITCLIAANAIFFTILLFLEIFECVPRTKIWTPTVPGRCINIEETFVATGAINVLDDFLILGLPMIWIWQLHTPTRRKMGIAAVFAAGLL